LTAETILDRLRDAEKRMWECVEASKESRKDAKAMSECLERYLAEYESILGSATVDDYFYVRDRLFKAHGELSELLRKREELAKSGSPPEALGELARTIDEKLKEAERLSSLLSRLEEKLGSKAICEEMRRRGEICITFEVRRERKEGGGPSRS